MQLKKTNYYLKAERKFFKKHQNLLDKYGEVLKDLRNDPFTSSLKTHKLKGNFGKYHSCSLTHEYRIVLTLKIVDDEIILVNIGTHDEVYN
jgi:addiction module RelE/StbE family toxin